MDNENKLKLIPKIEDYMEYIINIKLPRTEKFSNDFGDGGKKHLR